MLLLRVECRLSGDAWTHAGVAHVICDGMSVMDASGSACMRWKYGGDIWERCFDARTGDLALGTRRDLLAFFHLGAFGAL